jgi:hypothetical protein
MQKCIELERTFYGMLQFQLLCRTLVAAVIAIISERNCNLTVGQDINLVIVI